MCLTSQLNFDFYRFSEDHEFAKPNDVRALMLMDEAATSVMEAFADITLAFGESDEFRRVDFKLRNETPVAEKPFTQSASCSKSRPAYTTGDMRKF